MNNYKKIFESSVSSLIGYLKNNKLESMVLGISGGIDSSVCAVICAEVVKRDPTLSFFGVSLPCTTNTKGEISTADLIGKAWVQNFWTHEMQTEYETVERWCDGGAGSSTPISQGNIKARLRMIYLRNLAGLKKGILVDTDNTTENVLGFFTIAGDQGDVSPIAQLWKHEVYDLAEWMVENVAETEEQKESLRLSIGLTPTDGNGVKEGGDLAQIAPALKTYDELDEILMANERYKKKPTEANLYLLNLVTNKYGEDTVEQVMRRHKGSEFKRKPLPVVLELEGIDRGEPKKEDLLKHVSPGK
jgi:NAD+ synthetase